MWWWMALASAQTELASWQTEWVDAASEAWRERGVEQAPPSDSAALVPLLEWSGAQLAARDIAAWHGTDALMASGINPTEAGVVGYLTGAAEPDGTLPLHWLVDNAGTPAIRWTVRLNGPTVLGWPTAPTPDASSEATYALSATEMRLWTCREALLGAIREHTDPVASGDLNLGAVPVDLDTGPAVLASLYPAVDGTLGAPVGGAADLWCLDETDGVLVFAGSEVSRAAPGSQQAVHFRSSTLDGPTASLVFQQLQAGVPVMLMDVQDRLWGLDAGHVHFLGAIPTRRREARRAVRRLREQPTN